MTAPSFGDRRTDEVDFTQHLIGHPDAAVQFGIGNILRGAYLHAEQYGRVLIQQTWGYNVRNFSNDLSTIRASAASSNTAWVGVTRGWATIPRETSHLIAEVVYVLLNFAPVEVSHRLTARNGAGCNSSTSSVIYPDDSRAGLQISNGQLNASQLSFAQNFDAEFPFANVFSLRRATAKLALSAAGVGIANPGRCQIRLEQHALRTNDASGDYSIPVPYRPLFAQISAVMEW